MIKRLANGLHAMIARGPECLARIYIELLSRCCRTVFPGRVSTRIRNSITGHHFHQMSFSAREVIVGSATKINLVPHLGEFDEAGLFEKTAWLRGRVFQVAWMPTLPTAMILSSRLEPTLACLQFFSMHWLEGGRG